MTPRRGFTLIELLVVISLITILAALLVPAVRTSLTRSRQVACISNLKQVGIAITIYAGDHKGAIPPVTETVDGAEIYWHVRLNETMQGRKSWGGGVFLCPEQPDASISYGYNSVLGQSSSPYRKLAQIDRASATALAADVERGRIIGLNVPPGGQNRVAHRHGDLANWLFADSHVAPHQEQEFEWNDGNVRLGR